MLEKKRKIPLRDWNFNNVILIVLEQTGRLANLNAETKISIRRYFFADLFSCNLFQLDIQGFYN